MVKTSQNIEVLSRLNDFRKAERFCDIRLKIDGIEFPAHKNVLAGFSQYFEAMFSGEFTEAKKDIVPLESIECGIMENLLEYAYTSEIDLTNDNIQAIFHAANFLQVEPLFKACSDYFETNLSAENCVGIFNLSEVYPCPDLHSSARKFILANFRAVTQEIDYLELEAEKLINLIDDDILFVEKEEYVFDAVMRWFHYKEEDRKHNLLKVLNRVRLSDVDPYFLHSRVKGTKALLQSEECAKLFLETLFYQAMPKRRMELYSSISRLRATSPYVELCQDIPGTPAKACRLWPPSAVSLPPVLLITQKPDFLCNEVQTLVEAKLFFFPVFFSKIDEISCSSTSSYELFYVDNVTNVVSLFDYKEDTWTTTSISVVWLEKALRNLDGRWYTFEHGKNKIEVFDNSIWRTLPEPTIDVVKNVVHLNGMFYLVGGKTKDNKSSKLVQQFDPHTETWTRVGDLPHCHDCLKTCAFNGRIYVFSESLPSNSEQWAIEELDLSTGLWSANGNIPEKFQYHKISSVTVFKENIYVLLVKDNNYTIQVYSPTNNSWRDFPKIPDFDVTMIRCPMRIKRLVEAQ